ncbi:MAG: hypothetical protein JWQ98_822 [Chlorobi bacterium]|nr:hypothetical protein [Chlorobiota bacterium]
MEWSSKIAFQRQLAGGCPYPRWGLDGCIGRERCSLDGRGSLVGERFIPPTDPDHHFDAITFAPSGIGYAIAYTYDAPKLWKTTDEGRSWAPEPCNDWGLYYACSAPAGDVAHVVGDDGLILKTGMDTEKVHQVSALQIVPQPVVTVASIDFPPQDQEQTLHIFNVRGQMIRAITLPANSSRATLDNLPSGIYWCRIGSLISRFISVR